MFNLSLREDWANNKTFCHRLTDDGDDAEDKVGGASAENSKAKVSSLSAKAWALGCANSSS